MSLWSLIYLGMGYTATTTAQYDILTQQCDLSVTHERLCTPTATANCGIHVWHCHFSSVRDGVKSITNWGAPLCALNLQKLVSNAILTTIPLDLSLSNLLFKGWNCVVSSAASFQGHKHSDHLWCYSTPTMPQHS